MDSTRLFFHLISTCLILSFISCERGPDRVVPDTSIYETAPLDTIQYQLDKVINETSGLVKIGDGYWTNNDSGGEPAIYQFDPLSGDVIRTVRVNGVKNHDWEELTSDSTYIYIGDFGNNRGNRKNLAIYKVLISEVLSKDEVEAELIQFSYPDQTAFYSGYNHNHDSEGMITFGDSLYLFSKNWQDMRCKLYALPKDPGTYEAHMISEFDSRGTITAAALSDDQQEIYLLGYNPGVGFDPFVWTLRDWHGTDFLSGDRVRKNFSVRRQMEAIIMSNDSTLYITSEDEDGGYPSLFSYSF